MKRLMVVEDQAREIQRAVTVAESLGIGEIDAFQTVHRALASLEKGLAGEGPLPDGIVLDLDLGLESGFELLRFWRTTPALNAIPVMVWTVVVEQREVCELFGVHTFVSKWEGESVFRLALSDLLSSSTAP